MRGAGDRWLAGERIDGVELEQHAVVEIVGGAHDGRRGTVALLLSLGADPTYLVSLGAAADVRVRQSHLRRA